MDADVIKDSAPLPTPDRIRCRVDSNDVYFDIMMVAECINTFTKAMYGVQPTSLSQLCFGMKRNEAQVV